MVEPVSSRSQGGFGRLRIISALGLCQLVAFGTSLYLLTILAPAIVRDTGWPLAWVVGGYSVGVLVSAAVAPMAGRYVGAGRGRLVLAASSIAFAAGLGLMAVSRYLPLFLLAWTIMGLAMGSGLYDAAFGTAGRLFGATARSAIIQIALWGGFASTVFWPLSSLLVSHIGWRGACLVFVALHLGICLPLYLLAVPRAAAGKVHDVKALEAVRAEGEERPIYLALGFVVTCEMAIVAMMSVHMQTILASRGLSTAVAVGLSTAVGPSQVLARLLELTLGRRWPPYVSMALGVVGVSTGIGLIAFGSGLNLVALVIYGAGLGVVSITTGTVPLAIFGATRYPPLMGRIRRVSLVLQALAPAIGAALLGNIGINALLAFIVGLAAACLVVCLWLARRAHAYMTTGLRPSVD